MASSPLVALLFQPKIGRAPILDAGVSALLASMGHVEHGSEGKPLTCNNTRELDGRRVLEIRFSTSKPIAFWSQRSILSKLEQQHHLDLVIQPNRDGHRAIRLAVFDMDSTLIQQEVIDLLASYAGVEPAVADITSRAMNGELDFSASLRERVSLLKGIHATVFEDLKPRVTLTPGADVLLRCLNKLGAKSALLSGGFMPLATHIASRLSIDHVHANELEANGGKLNGKLAPGCVIVNAERKRELLRSIAEKEGVREASEILAVGDGANDLLMLGEAGLGIAVNAKPRVQELAPCRLNCNSLVDVLHVLGYTKEEIVRLAA